MRFPLRHLGLLGLLLTASLALTRDAGAAEEERRVLRARQVAATDETDALAEAAEAKRLQSIDMLKQMIAGEGTFEAPEGEQKAEMLLRLADLYFKQGRYLYLKEMKTFDEAYDKCFNTEGCNTASLKPDNRGSAEWQERSIKLYRQILQAYPRYRRADEAMFYLGSALADIGGSQGDKKRMAEANEQFELFVRQYESSPLVPDAHVAIGEFYFDDNNAYKALTAYRKATAFPQHEMYGFALYKLAWCYYNVGEYGTAIATMKSVVDFSKQEGSAGSKMQLGEEALKDLVRFFADAGELDEAYEYFKKLGKDDLIRSMLKRLAGMYTEQGKWEQAIQTYRRLIADTPNSKENPDYQNEIVQAYQKMGRQDETFTEIDRMLKTYGKESAWARANASDQDAVRAAEEMVEKNLRQVAFFYHNRAKKLGAGDEAKVSYAAAYKAYKVYLDEFPTNLNAYEVRYSFAELLYKVKKFDEAFDQYMAVVKMDPNGKNSKFCAESAIFAADEMVKKEGGGATTASTPASVKEALPLTDWEKRLIEACKQYAQLYPNDDKVTGVIYKSGYILYNKYRYEEAADQFRDVISKKPNSREAEQAANLILDSFVVNEDWANLKKNSQFFYEQEGLGSSTFKKETYGIFQRASLKIIEVEFEKSKDHSKTADELMAFAAQFPESDELPRVMNNASVYYHQANRVADAMKVRHILVEDPKFGAKTKYYYDQLAGLGFDYETIADFGKAANYYEKMFALYPKHRDEKAKDATADVGAISQAAADALYSAAVFRRALGDWKKAIDDYNQFTTVFPADPRVEDVKLTVGKIYEEQQQWSQAQTVYYNYFTKPSEKAAPEYVFFARLHYAKSLEALNQGSKATKVYEETVVAYQKYLAGGGQPGAHTEFVAEMMYKLAQPRFDRYAALKIEGAGAGASRSADDKALQKNLKAKADALLEVERLYSDIIKTGAGEWGIAGLVMLGRTYENMGESLKTSHIPTYLTDDQRELYNMALEDKVYPQVEKAVAAYKTALDKSYELTLYNEHTAHATRRLGELRPNDFPGLRESLPKVELTSTQTRSYNFETSY